MGLRLRPRDRAQVGGPTWKVGELAKRTGLSVRTLHYYEEVGLLKPCGRTVSGHRFYVDADIRRLQQIVSLRQLGFSLKEVREVIERRDCSLNRVIEKHLGRLRQQIALQRRLIQRLENILSELRSSKTVSAERFLETIEVMTMLEKYYTPEQMQELADRRRTLGEDRVREVEAEWPQLIAEVRGQMDQGADPSDPIVQTLAKRWAALVQEFTGGKREIEKSLGNMYRQEPSAAARYGLDPKIFEFMSRAMLGSSKTK